MNGWCAPQSTLGVFGFVKVGSSGESHPEPPRTRPVGTAGLDVTACVSYFIS